MKFLKLFFIALSLLSLQFCKKKTEVEDINTPITQKYQRGFLHEGEMLDVNFDPTLIGAFSTQTEKKLDPNYIDTFFGEFKDFAQYKEEIKQFYQSRNNAYAWIDDEGLTEQADHLAVKLMNLEKNNEKKKLTYQDQFNHLMDNEIDEKNESKIELLLTSQYLWYSKRTFEGTADTIAKKSDWLKPRNRFDVMEAMEVASKNGVNIFPDEPSHQHYVNLKNKILDFHKKGLDTITAQIPVGEYKVGDSSAVISQIKNRLFLLGDLKNESKTFSFDDEMLQAVHNFQFRHGLEKSDVINESFLNQMNIPGRERLETMMTNLERMRWISPDDGEYLLVNIPAYKLYAFNSQDFLWDMDVIVGSVNRRTVVFSDKMDYVDFAPYWNIPPGIMKRKIMPAMQKNPNYLEQNNMEQTKDMVLPGVNAVRQKPGPGNTLGKAKFMFPNSYNIYLHDTDQPGLFNRVERDLSSGCVRVSDAFKLAQFVLKNNPEINDETIREKMDGDSESRVILKKKMPVHLAYFTAFVNPDGQLIFTEDIYKRDQKLKDMLMLNSANSYPSTKVK